MKRSLRRAIKESADNLPSGICFADSNGVIILCNRQMHRLCHRSFGKRPLYFKSTGHNKLRRDISG